jgi:hypothetical protein
VWSLRRLWRGRADDGTEISPTETEITTETKLSPTKTELSPTETELSPTETEISPTKTEINEERLTAPVLGDVRSGFESHLAAYNALALPSVAADAGLVGSFWLSAASLAGLRHLNDGKSGQDSYSFRARGERAIAVAVADGLGAAPHTAQLGALAAARLICDELVQNSDADDSEEDNTSVHAQIEEVNRRLHAYRAQLFGEASDDDFATTLAFCLISQESGEASPKIVVGRVGDCFVFTLRRGEWESIFPRPDGAANVVKQSLPTQDSRDALEVKHLEVVDVDALVLTTDGLGLDLYMSPAVRAWLGECWAQPCGIFRLLDSLRYRRQGSLDDRTAAVVWMPGATGFDPSGRDAFCANTREQSQATAQATNEGSHAAAKRRTI